MKRNIESTVAGIRARNRAQALIVAGCLLAAGRAARAQQDIGHKLRGGLGIDAGIQSDAGLYVAARVVRYGANQAADSGRRSSRSAARPFSKAIGSRRISILASYDVNSRKRGIDIARGSTIQIQGGAGATIANVVTLGPCWCALWQVTADRGTALPALLRGQRDRVFGIGPEVQLALSRLGLRAEGRVEFDFGVRSRPRGSVVSGGLTYRRD